MARTKLGKISTKELEMELRRRQRSLEKLHTERERAASRLAELDREIAALGGEAAPAVVRPARKKRGRAAKAGAAGVRRRRRGGQPTLADMLTRVMSKDEPKRVTNLSREVQKAGYKTKSKTFATIVNQALINDPRFKKVGRGQYVLAE